jgi:itaconate CoA-transferase
LSLEHAVAAPFATRQLADLGARVIKIERPETGDFARGYDSSVAGSSSYFVWLNRSKESICLDVKTDEGHKILHELVDRSDVVVQNLGPGAADRLGLGAAEILRRDPRKIVLSITGWGSTGPWAHRKAYDLLAQCETGLVSLTGTPQEPARIGVSIADIAAGVYGFSAVLAALFQRERTGMGTSVEVSLFEALAEWIGQPMHFTLGSGVSPTRAGLRHATIVPYGPFMTSDSHTVVISIQSEPEWQLFCDVFLEDRSVASREEFTSNPLRVRHRDQLDAIIMNRFKNLDLASAVRLLEEARVAYAGINSLHDFLEHPVLAGRDRWRSIGIPGGSVSALLPPINFFGDEARMDPVPNLGEHTERILVELGCSTSDITRLVESGVVQMEGKSE